MVHLILRYIFAMPLAPMMAPAEHKQVHTTRFLKILKQVCCLSFLCIRLMPSDVRNVWQPKAVFQPLFQCSAFGGLPQRPGRKSTRSRASNVDIWCLACCQRR